MEHGRDDRRSEARYSIETKVMIHKSNGESIRATGSDISGAGMLLQVEQPSNFSVDEEVTVDVELPESPGKPFSSWGVAKITRIDGCRLGVHLCAGTFDTGS
jgi:c-di-GMP-binding flagellar brake protein YcgR